ncbi:MFS transporter (plasmid) [Burkholderia sp. FERM BP-3421]|jgi:predicted MFS family arabinose efflux permease|uniref:MFS transporter n=1 Tax=Burkholderia sp. FERM BP-3421 TaxID=1494466 RepID=UPI00236244C3|nr:MFS transporter [Burkholderia sp. FERM BP-3421]WDD90607.1 MFS transporter [Burkholderia sp. FERM BP-3421]
MESNPLEVAQDATAAAPDHSIKALLKRTRFRNVWLASAMSQFGDTCFMVTLPWLLLQMNHSGVVLGSVLTTLAVPRAALLLVGGAFSDRYSARSVLLVASLVQLACVATLAVLTVRHALPLPALYALVFCFGMADAFGSPAIRVLLPELVEREQIPAANALTQSTAQVSMLGGAAFIGVALDRWGAAPTLGVVAASFACLAPVLWRLPATGGRPVQERGLARAIVDGLRYVQRETSLRLLIIAITCVNFSAAGATQIGLVTLAHQRFGSSTDYGMLLVAAGLGSFVGMIGAGVSRRVVNMRETVFAACLALGTALAVLAIRLPFWPVLAVTFMLGVTGGYINVRALSWLQAVVRKDMLGRVMSVLAFASTGVAPLSLAVGGWLAQTRLDALFAGSGALVLLVAVCIGLSKRASWAPRAEPSEDASEA